MKPKAIAFLALAFVCASAQAKDGLVVHFTITKTAGNNVSTYTNGVLMGLTETSTFTFPGQYQVLVEARAAGDGAENLVVTVKDLSSGKPVYAGSGAANVQVGKSTTIPFYQLGKL
ncbi:MAG: hypothetical protein J0H15_09110 [Xanthomonadales bacterium]|nr:hypothetical protein [Xanthomonadales bacterium]